jgi:hypothetical protein
MDVHVVLPLIVTRYPTINPVIAVQDRRPTVVLNEYDWAGEVIAFRPRVTTR